MLFSWTFRKFNPLKSRRRPTRHPAALHQPERRVHTLLTNDMEVVKTEASVIDDKNSSVDEDNSSSKFPDESVSAVDLGKLSRATMSSSPVKEDMGYRSSIVVVEPREDCKSEESEDEVLDLSGSPRFQGPWDGDASG